MDLEVFKTMESALKQDLVCPQPTSFYPSLVALLISSS